MTASPAPLTHFGFETVPLEDKQERVNAVFHQVAGRYDLMNDVMSLGVHRLWKQAMVSWMAPSRTGPWHGLDVAGGTGDIAFRLLEKGGKKTRVTVCDINPDMLQEGRIRAKTRQIDQSRLAFCTANAEALPFEEYHFDSYSIAFGLRNVPRIEQALNEAYRVLKFGGRFACLEFSHVDMPGLDKIYEAYSFHVIPRLGKWIAGDDAPYQYLVESIRQFPRPRPLEDMLRAAGFKKVTHTPMSGGIVALHTGWKI